MKGQTRETWQAFEALAGLCGVAFFAIAGYQVALSTDHDGKRAMIGLGYGAIAYAFTISAILLAFHRAYRARGGSPLLLLIIAWLFASMPLVGLVLSFVVPHT